MSDNLPRKLAAILYADVAGYSRLTGADEDGTHRVLREYLRLVSTRIEEHNGRVVHFAGDAVLADFATVLDAVTCASAIQHELTERNRAHAPERQFLFRIGVNLGDVIVDGGEIYGDGVNVAARLQSIAQPGGICISHSVHTALGAKAPLPFEDMGEQQVKNITEPVRAWQWIPDTGRIGPRASKPASDDGSEPVIAVLPLQNLTRDAEVGSLGDGIAEEIVTAFSRQSGIRVLSRGSTEVLRDQPGDRAEQARRLGAHYLVEGSVRSAGNRVRVSVRLVDALTGNDLWGEQYDRDTEDLFVLQDELRLTIVSAVRNQIHVKDAQRVRDLPEPQLTDGELLALASQRTQALGVENYRDAARILRIVTERSPDNAMALAMSASCITLVNEYDYQPLPNDEADRAFELVDRAVRLNDESDYAHYVRGKLLLGVRRDHDLAIREAERALQLNPDYTYGLALLGYATACKGDTETGIALIEKAVRADPRRAGTVDFCQYAGIAEFVAGHYESAIRWLERACQGVGQTPKLCFVLASSYALLGQLEPASGYVDTALAQAGDARVENIQTPPFARTQDEARFLDGLRKAGLD